jgi:hypothetical protein
MAEELSIVSTRGEPFLLAELRGILEDADEALLCVAFADNKGVNLLERQLRDLGAGGRLLTTTTFGTTKASALDRVQRLDVAVKILNPAGGTSYHPKLYLTRSKRRAAVLLGSANMTGGLATNYEVGTLVRGAPDDPQIVRAWELGERFWTDDHARDWKDTGAKDDDEFEQDLFKALEELVAAEGGVVSTLGPLPKANKIRDVTRTGLYVETGASQKKGRPAQLIPASMIQIAWDYLRAHGELSNAYLVANEGSGLNVKRSSAVCAILARLPGVELKPGKPIVLRWAGR